MGRKRLAATFALFGLFLILTLPLVGSGTLNGDAAVYAAQALSGNFHERTVHLGYIGLASLLGSALGSRLPLGLDLLNLLSAVGAAAILARISSRRGHSPWMASAVFLVVALPRAPFAEVDLPWVTLALLALLPRSPLLAALSLVGAVFISPTALGAIPFLVWFRVQEREEEPSPRVYLREGLALVAGAVIALGAFTAWDASDYWLGDRGLLRGSGQAPWRTFETWVSRLLLPGVLVPAVLGWSRGGLGGLLLLTPYLLLTPSDVPAWLLAAAPLALSAAEGWASAGMRMRRLILVGLLGQGGLSLRQLQAEARRVQEVAAFTSSLAARMSPEDALVAPWGMGVRVAISASGEPYGLPWTGPEPEKKSGDRRWCGAEVRRLAVLPPGRVIEGEGEGTIDSEGVYWYRTTPERWNARLRCDKDAASQNTVESGKEHAR